MMTVWWRRGAELHLARPLLVIDGVVVAKMNASASTCAAPA
jgi:hypothetical protein